MIEELIAEYSVKHYHGQYGEGVFFTSDAVETLIAEVRQKALEEALEVARDVARKKYEARNRSDYPSSRYGEILHNEMMGAKDVMDELSKLNEKMDNEVL